MLQLVAEKYLASVNPTRCNLEVVWEKITIFFSTVTDKLIEKFNIGTQLFPPIIFSVVLL